MAEIGEGMSIQIVARPAPASAKKTIARAAAELNKGESLERIMAAMKVSLSDVTRALAPKKPETEEKQGKVVDAEAVKALEMKLSQPLLQVNFRVLASAADYAAAESLANSVAGSFSQFQAPRRGELVS